MTAVSSEAQVEEFVRAARADRAPFEIVAGGTRRAVGRPAGELPTLDVSGLAGIVKYEPEELIVTAAPATPLTEIRAALAEKNQCLGFDPADWSLLLGSNGTATLGGAVSADANGPGRLRHGAARDSLLGFRAVNGLGESFRAGAKVVKNVTGFDLPKLVCGAFGTLCVLTELTFRVYPKARHAVTLCIADVSPEIGLAHLRKIAHSALEPAGLFYLPACISSGAPLHGDIGAGAALIRLEGAEAPLAEKVAMAHGLLGDGAQATPEGDRLFDAVRSGLAFAGSDLDVWRVAVPPSEAARAAKAIEAPLWLGDWAGGMLWVGAPPSAAAHIRATAAACEGHAMLLRASAENRAAFGLYAPQPAALAALSGNVKAAFDPLGLFNPGRL
jgi:glycolate oxidase FAD binding subunit